MSAVLPCSAQGQPPRTLPEYYQRNAPKSPASRGGKTRQPPPDVSGQRAPGPRPFRLRPRPCPGPPLPAEHALVSRGNDVRAAPGRRWCRRGIRWSRLAGGREGMGEAGEGTRGFQ